MTVPPLTERLKDAAAHAGAKYLTALLLETAEAVEFATEKIASLSQSAADLDTARQAAEARVAELERTLESFSRLDLQLRTAEKFERRYGIHIGGDSALGGVFAWIDELCAQARALVAKLPAETDGGEK